MATKQERSLARRKARQLQVVREVEGRKSGPERRKGKLIRLYNVITNALKCEPDTDLGLDVLIMVIAGLIGSIAARTGVNLLPEIQQRIAKAAGHSEAVVREEIGVNEDVAPTPVLSKAPWWRRAWLKVLSAFSVRRRKADK